MNPYFPVLVLLIITIPLAVLFSLLSYFLGPQKKYTPSKLEAYECGVPQVGNAKEKFSVRYYLVAILFILFDIETIFLYLWAKHFNVLGWFGVIEVAVFLIILFVGYIYVWRRGALEWD